MKQYNTILIDDEWLILTELKTLLSKFPQINIIGEATNVNSGIQLVKDTHPDLLFLDIHIPGGSGFDILNKTDGKFKVVFVTAFDQYRKEAQHYKSEAYLMKPINIQHLAKVIENL